MKKAILVLALVMGAALVAGPIFAQTAPTKVVLKGNPMGGVNFDHAKHAKLVGDIRTARIAIEDGAFLKGNIDIVKTEAPKPPAAPRPQAAPPAAQPAPVVNPDLLKR